MELGLTRKYENGLMHAIVNRHKLDDEGNAFVNINNNPLIATRAYEVEFYDGTTEFLTATIIVEYILVQADEEGHRQILADEIIDHRQDVNAIVKEDAFTKTPNGMKQIKMTTSGCQLCIQCKDRSTNWVALK